MDDTKPDPLLPLLKHGVGQSEDGDACSPSAYVSNEEAALAAALRGLRAKAVAVRAELESLEAEDESDRRTELEKRLAELRAQWAEVAGRREGAWRRKMIMLGHLPPQG